MADGVDDAFRRSVDEGHTRLTRTWPELLATGAVGGIDVSVGVFAMYVVRKDTGSELLGALAFTIGFIALTLANSELFTENFLVPVVAVVAKDASVLALVRLWLGTAVSNLAGGFGAMWLVITAFPALRPTAIVVGSHATTLGIASASFASAILAGAAITLMTWMERGTDNVTAKLLSAMGVAFLLAAAPLDHAIVVSLEAFSALHSGAPFGYLDWLGILAWASLGNLLGGVGLVTLLRLVQVGRETIQEEQDRAPGDVRPDDPPDQ